MEAKEEIPCDKGCASAPDGEGGLDNPFVPDDADVPDNSDVPDDADPPDNEDMAEGSSLADAAVFADNGGDIVHAADCAYQPAVEGVPCGHLHSGAACGFEPSPDAVCDHVHDESCGYEEARAGTPCTYVCEICNAPESPETDRRTILSWTWVEEDGLLVWGANLGCYTLGIPGASRETPLTREALMELLPTAVTAQLEDGTEERLDLTWDLSVIPEEGAFEGSYTLTPVLPEGYALAEGARGLSVLLDVGGGAEYDYREVPAVSTGSDGKIHKFVSDWSYVPVTGAAAIRPNGDDYHFVTDVYVETSSGFDLKQSLNLVLPSQIECKGYTADGLLVQAGFTLKSGSTDRGYVKIEWQNMDEVLDKMGPINDGITALELFAKPISNPGYLIRVNTNDPEYKDTKQDAADTAETDDILNLTIILHLFSIADHKIFNTSNPTNTTVNLFDYWVNTEKPTAPDGDILTKSDWHYRLNADSKGNPTGGETNTAFSTVSDWNRGINEGHLLLFGDGLIHAGLWNKGAGESTQYGNQHAGMEGIVRKHLENGYPVINTSAARTRPSDYTLIRDYQLAGTEEQTLGTSSSGIGFGEGVEVQNLSENVIEKWGKDIDIASESLNYLFDPDLSVRYRNVYENVGGLFQLDDEGYYYYYSRQNFAEYNQGTNRFILYDAPATVRTDGEHSIGNFFPFNTGSEVFTGVDASGKLTSSVPCSRNTMNHHLGMTVEIEFRQPAGGVINTGKGNTPMTFQFTGDDDVWVFIDDVLVLDLGGVHSEIYGTIDFASGEVCIGRAFGTKGVPEHPKDPANLETLTTLKALFTDAGSENDTSWSGNTFSSDTNHTLKMFYLERGNYDSSLALRFNLQPQLYQYIKKVDQDGNPMEGVEFALYAAEVTSDTSAIQCLYTDSSAHGKEFFYVSQSGNGSLATLTTKSDGVAQFMNGDEPFNFADQKNSYYILKEVTPPAGYRAIPTDVVLHYDSETAMLSVANRWTTGAYACSISNVSGTGNLTYGYLNAATDDVVVDTREPVHSDTQSKGLVVAVPMLKQASTGTWAALYGSNMGGFHAEQVSQSQNGSADSAVLRAALRQAAGTDTPHWYLSWDEENRRLYGELSDLPGLASRYQINNSSGDMRMVYGIIEENALVSLGINEGDAESRYKALGEWLRNKGSLEAAVEEAVREIMGEEVPGAGKDFRFLNTSQFNRNFRALIYIPNEQRELWVMKVDENGVPVNGAEFGLYSDEGCTQKIASGKTGSITMNDGTELKGVLIFSPRDDGPGHAKIEWASNTRTKYYLQEISAPNGLETNKTVIPVVVGTYSIYADAGEEGDGVSVMAGVGRLTQTMYQYANDGEVDITLRDITAYGQIQPSENTEVSPGDWTDMELNTTVANKVKRFMDLHFKMNAMVDYGLHDVDGGKLYKPFFVTDTGYIRARVEQNYPALTGENNKYESPDKNANKDNLTGVDITSLFSLLNVVVVTDDFETEPNTGKLTIKKTITDPSVAADCIKNFTFTVHFTDANGNSLTGSYYFWGQDKAGQIQSGNEIVLHHDEEITILGLPAGTHYSVREASETGWHVSPSSGTISGIIGKGETAQAHFENSKDPFNPPKEEKGSLTISKTVTGAPEDLDQEFTFTVTFSSSGSFPYTGSKSGTISSGGTVRLKHGESITIKDIPAGTTYTVSESGNSGYTVTSSGAVGTIQANSTAAAAFTNSKEPTNPPDNPPPENPPENPPPENPPDEPPPENPPENPPPENPPDNPPDTPEPPETPDTPEPPDSPVTELPDPNDPNAPDRITILEDGVPTTYIRVWDPEKEEWVWIPEEDLPLDSLYLPMTGDDTRFRLWALLAALSLAGLSILHGEDLRKKKIK